MSKLPNELASLRPQRGADLPELEALLLGQDWHASMPSRLPDAKLLELARDFRLIEASMQGEDPGVKDKGSYKATATYIVINLLMKHPARKDPKKLMDVTEQGLARALECYQWGLEREITSRILGISSETFMATLADELWASAHE